MEADSSTTYTLTFTADEMVVFAGIIAKIARPTAGFQRPSWTVEELIMIAEVDKAIHGEQPKGPNVTSV